MTYANEDRSVVEHLWNSRDGVAPFCIMSRDRDELLTHVDWDKDERLPGYIPKIGMRIFVDLSVARARQLAKEQAERRGAQYVEEGFAGDIESAETRFFDALLADVEQGEPDIVVDDENLREIRRDAFRRTGARERVKAFSVAAFPSMRFA